MRSLVLFALCRPERHELMVRFRRGGLCRMKKGTTSSPFPSKTHLFGDMAFGGIRRALLEAK